MIIKRGVRVQLLIFAVITVLTMAYTLINIIGIGQGVLDLRYKVQVDLADSGGIFSNAEVTYRGVTVGRVGPLRLTSDGVRAELRIDRDRKVPANGVQAYVLNRSGVGEQYVDLRPAGPGRSLRDGDVIPRGRTHLPVPTHELLAGIDALVRTLDPNDLAVVVDELDKGLSGAGPDIRSLLDSNRQLLDALERTYPETVRLLRSGRKVLDTQVAEGSNFGEFARNLAELSTEIKNGDGDIRRLLGAAPDALGQGSDLLHRLEPTLPTLLANGSVVGSVLTSRASGIQQMLVIYPLLVGGAFTTTPGDGTVHFGLELNFNRPPACTKGYERTRVRYPQDTRPASINRDASCKLPKNSETAVRGSRNAPPPDPYPRLPPGATSGAGFPYETSNGARAASSGSEGSGAARRTAAGPPSGGLQDLYIAGYDPRTRVYVGPDGRQYRWGRVSQLTGDASWQTLLLSPVLG